MTGITPALSDSTREATEVLIKKAKENGYVPGFKVKTIVDTVGAGDGFAAGVLTELCEGQQLKEAARRGCAIGAIQLMSKGDNDGLPTVDELTKFM